jgi:hypothetical protein
VRPDRDEIQIVDSERLAAGDGAPVAFRDEGMGWDAPESHLRLILGLCCRFVSSLLKGVGVRGSHFGCERTA